MDTVILEPAVQPEEPCCVEINSTLATKVNLADFQNAVPVIRELSLVNDTKSDYKSLRLTVGSEPPFLKPKTWHIDHLASGQTVRLTDIDLGLAESLERFRRHEVRVGEQKDAAALHSAIHCRRCGL